jgi:hypothetical protein
MISKRPPKPAKSLFPSREQALACLEDAIYFEPDESLVKELVRIWRKMGKKVEKI